MKQARTPVTYGDVRKEVEREQYGSSEDEDDIIDQKWAAKKCYSTTQLIKKMDAVGVPQYSFIYIKCSTLLLINCMRT